MSDTISTARQPIPKTAAEERAVVENFNKPMVTRQRITVNLTTESGIGIRVTQERILTNRMPGARRIQGIIGGYTFTMETPTITLLP